YRVHSVVKFVILLVCPVRDGSKLSHYAAADHCETDGLALDGHEPSRDWTGQLQPVRQDLEKFDSADRKSNRDGYDRHRKIVLYFSNWPQKRPAIRGQHSNPISHIDQDHSTSEHERENEDHP